MTAKTKIKEHRTFTTNFGTFFFCLVIAFSLLMIVRNSEIAIKYMQTGLRLCAHSVIPSLFPFMVISELLVASGFGEIFGKYLGAPFRRLFGVSRAGSSAVLLGAICGFPVGAKTAASLYDRGVISKAELERLLSFCNIPSSGFLISAVGVSLFSSHSFGVFLYITALVAAVLSGLFGRRFRQAPRGPGEPLPRHAPRIGVGTFTAAVSSATASMLSVCAYVIFFSSTVGCLTHLLQAVSLPDYIEALLFGVFEISSGVSAAAALETAPVSAALCGFVIGWSGISVHFQIMALCDNRGISFSPYFLSKLFQGLFCSAAAWFYVKFIDTSLFSESQSASIIRFDTNQIPYALSICLIFLMCVIMRYRRKSFPRK